MNIKISYLAFNHSLLSFLLILFLFTSINVNATDYYISATGDDTADGLTTATPWQTIDKVNAVFSSIPAGSNIYFNRGDTFYGSIIISKSGTSGSPITLSAYGAGAKPIITGFVTIPGSSWTAEPGLTGIYSAASVVTTSILANMVTIDSKQVGMGRYPDKSFLTYEATNGTNTITDIGLGTTINWKGAGMAFRKNDWTLDRASISNHVGDVLTYSNLGTNQAPSAGFGYFIMNDLRTLTSYGEWYHKPATKKFYMYFGDVDPATKVVQVANISDLITNTGSYDYITVDNLNLTGAINNAVNLTTGNDFCTIQNCDISFIGNYGIYLGSGKNRTADNNTIRDCNSHGVYDNYGSFATITNNTISDIARIPGQSYYTYGNNGIYSPGNGCIISYNTIKRTGYCGICIKYTGAATVSYNYIDSVCLVLNDGGGIYMPGPNASTRLVDHNIITNVIGNGAGAIRQTSLSEGIYLDEGSSNVVVTNNSVANSGNSGIKLHKATNDIITDNTTFHCGRGLDILNTSGAAINWNQSIKRNIFLAKTSAQYTVVFGSVNDISLLGVLDSNYYARPVDDTKSFAVTINGSWSTNTLATWQTITGKDANSKKSPVKISSYDDIRFEINPSKESKTIALNGKYITVDSKIYDGSVTLQPFSSVILMKYIDTAIITQSLEKKVIKVIPSLISNQINIEIEGDNESHELHILNAMGRIVYSGTIAGKTMIESSSFTPGIYFVRIENANTYQVMKVIKK
ncbi:MAG: right-handed parallel beta-helix repeat-containing protein [Bacteroidales bacterium]